MKRIFLLILFIIFASSIYSRSSKLHLVFTNNIHGAIHELPARFINPEFSPLLAGGAGAYTYITNLRKEASEAGDFVILTDAGNLFQGTQLGTDDGGTKIMKWMNWMAYDAFVPGVRDFDQGVENLERLKKESNFPFLASNLKGVNGIENYKVIDANGIKIGLIGLITPFLFDGLVPENYEGVEVLDLLETLNTQIETIRNDVDLIFVLSHLGLPYNREDEYESFIKKASQEKLKIKNAIELAHFTNDVDVIITGGVSKGYDTPWVDPNTHTIVIQNYGNLTGIGHLILNVDKEKKIINDYTFPTERGMMVNLFTDNIWPDLAVQDSISGWVNSISSLHNRDYMKQISEIEGTDCSSDNINAKFNEFDVLSVGKDNLLDIMTWNMERFPLKGDTTMKAVAELIQDLNVDIIGVQEIIKIGAFSEMMSWLPNYNFVISKQSSFLEQAIIYKKNMFTVLAQDEPFAMDDYYFAGRPPLVVDFLYHCGDVKKEICVVNMHLKCCGDGLYRRQQSMKQLHGFLKEKSKKGKDNIIVVGDWNDQLQDTGIYQSFSPFINDQENFLFVTSTIVNDPNQQSYPSWPSFLDHILIGRGYFDVFEKEGIVRSVNLDEWIGGWEEYESIISDHRPILLSIPIGK
ncbi:MAG: endonuclease/exonuclease/phosphatase family protein [Candidatus Neomarinimicrobiota bacterium]